MVVFYITLDSEKGDIEEEDEAMRERVPIFCAISCLIVLMQCLSTAGLSNSSLKSSCVSADQCLDRGTFCHPKIDRCEYCGSDEAVIPPWTSDLGDNVFVWEPSKPGYNYTWVVEYCHGRIELEIREMANFVVENPEVLEADALRINWCHACVDFELEIVDNWGLAHLWHGNISAMGKFVRKLPLCSCTVLVIAPCDAPS
jgi:hypothetical protein